MHYSAPLVVILWCLVNNIVKFIWCVVFLFFLYGATDGLAVSFPTGVLSIDLVDVAYDLTGHFGGFWRVLSRSRGCWHRWWLQWIEEVEPVLLGYWVLNLEEMIFFTWWILGRLFCYDTRSSGTGMRSWMDEFERSLRGGNWREYGKLW